MSTPIPIRPQIWVARLCLFAAIAGAGYLAAISLANGAVAGCGPGSGCSQVLSSRWAYWVGIPVSIPALATYIALLLTTWGIAPSQTEQRRFVAWITMVALSGVVIAAALWFAFIQYAILGRYCRFCLATHASAVVASVCLLYFAIRNPLKSASLPSEHHRTASLKFGFGMSLVAFVILIAGQVVAKKRLYGLGELASQGSTSAQKILLFNGRFALDSGDVPLLGSASAPELVVYLFDYTCVHCRHLHPLLKEAAARSGGRFAIIALPAPLDAACNPLIRETQIANLGACDYARLALAVWHARPDVFPDFDEWLFSAESPPSLDLARARAETLVGKDALDEAIGGRWVRNQLAADVKLYIESSTAMKNARLPQLIFAGAVAYGRIDDAAELNDLIESHPLIRRPVPPRPHTTSALQN